ncbi:TolC family protein [Sulfurimonas sp.]
MNKLLLGALFFATLSQAMTLSEVIQTSLAKSPSLAIIEARLHANKQNIDIADQFDNPELLLTKNTLDNSQAMSQTVLTFKQKLPYFSKRSKRADVSIAEQKVLEADLSAAKVKLVERIKNEAYTIWELGALRDILDEYIELTRRNINLYESYTSVSDNEHMGIMKAELSLSDLQVNKASLDAQIDIAYSRLSYLTALKVNDLQIALKIKQKPNFTKLKASLASNPELVVESKKILKQRKKVDLADINNYPDLNVIAGYAYREKFDNYFNVGLSLSLPIYGTEDAKEERERALLLEKHSQKNDIALKVLAQLEAYYAQMSASYKIYHIIQDDALPQVAHMFELSSSSISVGSDLFKYIDVLFLKLDLEKKSIKAVANYKRAEAQIAALRGDLQ